LQYAPYHLRSQAFRECRCCRLCRRDCHCGLRRRHRCHSSRSCKTCSVSGSVCNEDLANTRISHTLLLLHRAAAEQASTQASASTHGCHDSLARPSP
jgi:hypothetical protein